MCDNYDEDINRNVFFKVLLNQHGDLLKEAASKDWIICVPKQATIKVGDEISVDTILNHILINVGENKYTTLRKKQVSVVDKHIKSVYFGKTTDTLIHFEEISYINNVKYTIWCLEEPLFGEIKDGAEDRSNEPQIRLAPIKLASLNSCMDFLLTEDFGNVFQALHELGEKFNRINANKCKNQESLHAIYERFHKKCLGLIGRRLIGFDSQKSERLKVAIETYTQCIVGNKIMYILQTLYCEDEAKLNKIICNTRDFIDFHHLEIPQKFEKNINKAKAILGKINEYETVLEKTSCLEASFAEYSETSASEMLQICIYSIVKLQVNNWIANLVYVTKFKCTRLDPTSKICFYLATFEAAIEFLKNGLSLKENHPMQSLAPFEALRQGDLSHFKTVMTNSRKTPSQLCHPLCRCKKCEQNCLEFEQSSTPSNYDLLNSNGQTLLIYASLINACPAVDFLIHKIDVNVKDNHKRCALHYACAKGHQSVVLMLLDARNINVNVKDARGDTPLHLACANGHGNCVKALIYSCRNLSVNCANSDGDTPLHLAVKWNFVDCVRVLLENEANFGLRNTSARRAIEYANNDVIRALFPSVEYDYKKFEESKFFNENPALMKRLQLLFRAIENDDFPLTCYHLGSNQATPTSLTNNNIQYKALCDSSVLNVYNYYGWTVLHQVARYGRLDTLRLLLKQQTLDVAKRTLFTLHTPLHVACKFGQVDAVRELIKRLNRDDMTKNFINEEDHYGKTALVYAREMCGGDLVGLLLREGADDENFEEMK